MLLWLLYSITATMSSSSSNKCFMCNRWCAMCMRSRLFTLSFVCVVKWCECRKYSICKRRRPAKNNIFKLQIEKKQSNKEQNETTAQVKHTVDSVCHLLFIFLALTLSHWCFLLCICNKQYKLFYGILLLCCCCCWCGLFSSGLIIGIREKAWKKKQSLHEKPCSCGWPRFLFSSILFSLIRNADKYSI